MEYKISKLTIIKWYRINYKRVCYENYKLKQENEKLLSELSKAQCDSRQLEEKIREYEIGIVKE